MTFRCQTLRIGAAVQFFSVHMWSTVGLGCILAGSLLWGVPWLYLHLLTWSRCVISCSLAQEFNIKTNCYLHTPGRYLVRLRMGRRAITGLAGFDNDSVGLPEHLDCRVGLIVQHAGKTLVDTNVTRTFGTVLGEEYISYGLAAFDLNRRGKLTITAENRLLVKELASVPSAIEVMISSVTLTDRAIFEQLGRYTGAPFLVLGLLALVTDAIQSIRRRKASHAVFSAKASGAPE